MCHCLGAWIQPCLKPYPNFVIQKHVLFTEVKETEVSVICLRGLQYVEQVLAAGGTLGRSSGPMMDELRSLPSSRRTKLRLPVAMSMCSPEKHHQPALV